VWENLGSASSLELVTRTILVEGLTARLWAGSGPEVDLEFFSHSPNPKTGLRYVVIQDSSDNICLSFFHVFHFPRKSTCSRVSLPLASYMIHFSTSQLNSNKPPFNF